MIPKSHLKPRILPIRCPRDMSNSDFKSALSMNFKVISTLQILPSPVALANCFTLRLPHLNQFPFLSYWS